MSVSTKMTAIADKIRSLLGLTGTMGLDAMASNLGEVEDEVDSQTELINQIVSALEGKVSSDSANINKFITITTEECSADLYYFDEQYNICTLGAYSSANILEGILFSIESPVDVISDSDYTYSALGNSIDTYIHHFTEDATVEWW